MPTTYFASYIRGKIIDVFDRANKQKRKLPEGAVMEIATEKYDPLCSEDHSQPDPSAVAEIREELQLGKRMQLGKQSAVAVASVLPKPSAVAARVTKLREVMFASINEADVKAVMEAVLEKAQGGDLAAAKIVIGLLTPKEPAQPVNAVQVVINPDEVL